MAETTSTEPKPAESKTTGKKTSETEVPPLAEAGPAITATNASYVDPPGNWSDPPELAEGENEVKGSMAKPLEEDAKEEREKTVKEEKERVAKAHEENSKKAEERAKWEIEDRKRREGRAA